MQILFKSSFKLLNFIETNSKTIELGAENESIEKLQEAASDESNAIGALDLLLVGLAALVVGFVIAIFYIQRNTKKSARTLDTGWMSCKSFATGNDATFTRASPRTLLGNPRS